MQASHSGFKVEPNSSGSLGLAKLQSDPARGVSGNQFWGDSDAQTAESISKLMGPRNAFEEQVYFVIFRRAHGLFSDSMDEGRKALALPD